MRSQIDQLILTNALAGVSFAEISASLHLGDGEAEQRIHGILETVREWIAAGFHPYFPCSTLEDARQHKARIVAVLQDVALWTYTIKPVAQHLIKGGNWQDIEGMDRTGILDAFSVAIIYMTHYLQGGMLTPFMKNPTIWIKANRGKAMELLERIPSLEGGRRLKNITFQTETSETIMSKVSGL